MTSAIRLSTRLNAPPDALPQVSHNAVTLLILMATVSTIPAETLVVIEGFGTLTLVLGLAAVFMTVLDCLKSGRLRNLTAAHTVMCGYLIWNAITVVWTVNTGATLHSLWSYVQKLIFVWVLHELSEAEQNRRAIIGSYVGGAVFAAALIIGAFYKGNSLFSLDGRYGVAGSDPNDLGLALVIAVPLAVHLATTATAGLRRLLAISSVPVLIAAILLTGSRGAVVALLASCLAITARYLTIRRTCATACLLLVTCGAAVYFAVDTVPTALVSRYVNIRMEVREGGMSNRRAIWQDALELIRSKPLTGWGSGAFADAAGSYSGIHDVAHNTYLSVAAEQGVPGVLLFAAILICITCTVRAGGRSALAVWIPVLGAWGVGIAGLTWEPVKVTWLIFGLFAGYGPSPAPQSPARYARRRHGELYESAPDIVEVGRWGR